MDDLRDPHARKPAEAGASADSATPSAPQGRDPHPLSPLPPPARGPHALSPLPPSGSGPAPSKFSEASAAFAGDFPVLLPWQDLTSESLLVTAPRQNLQGKSVPVLGGIALWAKLGQGGMGAVYYGLHSRLQKDVAVKVLPLHLARQQPELIQRFLREARIAARVQSPHLVGVLDVNEEGGLFYLVMEFVRGLSAGGCLKQLKAQGRTGLEEAVALELCLAACRGLAAAHAEGIVHRDVKPDNVLVPYSRTGESLQFQAAKLADLGLARSADLHLSLTATRVSMGTPGYMAPEQAMDAKGAGPPADVFSLGALLYALLGGRAPFSGTSVTKVLFETLHNTPEPIGKYRPEITAGTAALLDRCLQKDPARRYADGAELAAALQACLATLPAPAVTLLMPGSTARVQEGQKGREGPQGPERPYSSGRPIGAAAASGQHAGVAASSGRASAFVEPASPAPTPSPLPVPASAFAAASGAPPAPAGRRSGRLWLVLLAFVLLAGGAGYGVWSWQEQEAARRLSEAVAEAEARAKDAKGVEEALTRLERTEAEYRNRPGQDLAPLRELKAQLQVRRDRQAFADAVAAARAKGQELPKIPEALDELRLVELRFKARPEVDLSPARELARELELRHRAGEIAETLRSAEEKARAPEDLEEGLAILRSLLARSKDEEGAGLTEARRKVKEWEARRTALTERKHRFQSLLTEARVLVAADPQEALNRLADAERLGLADPERGWADLWQGLTPGLDERRREAQAALRRTQDEQAAREKTRREAELLKAFQAGYEEAQDAAKAGDEARTETALKNALSALGTLDHPLKPAAQTQLTTLQSDRARRIAFKELLKKAEDHLEAQRYAEARAAFEEAQRLWPLAPEAGRVEKGLATVRERLGILSAQSQLAAAQDLLAQRRWKDAQAAFEELLSKRPRDEQVQAGLTQARYEQELELGRQELRQERWIQAQAAFERALAVKPHDPAAARGAQQARDGASEKAYQAVLVQGLQALEHAQWNQASALFVRAIEHRPQSKAAKKGLAAAQGREFKLSANADWPDSGVRVHKGDKIHITASGHWVAGVAFAGPQARWPEANGRTAFFRVMNKDAEGHLFYAETLIGRIADGEPFYVGKARTFEAQAEGALRFRMNEEGSLGGLRDNGGELTLVLHVVPADLLAAPEKIAPAAPAPPVVQPALPPPAPPAPPAPVPAAPATAAFGPPEVLSAFGVYANLTAQGIPLDKSGKVIPLALDLDKEQYEEAIKGRRSLMTIEKGTRVRIEATGKWFSGPTGDWVTPDGRYENGREALKQFRAFPGPKGEYNIAMLVVFVCDKEKPVTEDFARIAAAGHIWACQGQPLDFVMPVTGILRFQQNRDGYYDVTQGALAVTVTVSKPRGGQE